MKRGIYILVVALGVLTAPLTAQVMTDSGVKNTMWTGLGWGFGDVFGYYGATDCLAARIDIWQFTVEGMINWGILTDWDYDNDFSGVWFGNTTDNALSLHYYGHGAGDKDYNNEMGTVKNKAGIDLSGYFNNAVINDTQQSDHYVNVIWNAVAGLQFGIGTKLNWGVGPAPGYNGYIWEHDAHIRQGGFSTRFDDRDGISVPYHQFLPDRPGTADVVGFVHYANSYAKKAIGVRYKYDGESFGFEVGASIPQDTHTDRFAMNLAGSIRPIKWLTISTVLEGVFHRDMNWYSGVDLQLKYFGLDAYFTWDNIDSDATAESDQMSWSTGVAFSIKAAEDKMLFRPEFAINWFQEDCWTPAWYVGLLFDFDVVKVFNFNVWASFAMGSRDTRWGDDGYPEDSDDWDGGIIFDIRPQFTFNLGERHALSLYIDLEDRRAFDQYNRFGFSTGVYWTYKLLTGKLTFAQKEKKPGEESEKSQKAKN